MKKIKNVLIVDDDLVSSYLVQSTLEEMGVARQIANVYNGQQALDFLAGHCLLESDKAEEFCPAFILLDLNMPVMDGFEFLEEFQNRYALLTCKISICILSSSSAQKDKLKAKQFPIVGFITKPLQEAHLLSILNRI